jgi:MAF protein
MILFSAFEVKAARVEKKNFPDVSCQPRLRAQIERPMPSPPLILASTSPFRRELLGRLGLPFTIANPAVDESPLPGEEPEASALRLAEAKARAVAGEHCEALIIGSDQVACLDGQVFGKPGNHANAVRQLQAMRGRRVTFFTGCMPPRRQKRQSAPTQRPDGGHLPGTG